MKRVLIVLGTIAVILIVAFFSLRTFTKSKSPAAVAEINQNGLEIRVEYSRPYKKGRVIFGPEGSQSLEKYGKVWRTGANEATLIAISQDVAVAGQALKAGTYSFWTIPSPQGWIAIFNGETGQWGTSYDQQRDVLRVPVPVQSRKPPVEQFTIDLVPQTNGADMQLAWDETLVTVPIRKQ